MCEARRMKAGALHVGLFSIGCRRPSTAQDCTNSTSGRGRGLRSTTETCEQAMPADSPHLPNLACSAQVKSTSGAMLVQFEARSAGRDRGSTRGALCEMPAVSSEVAMQAC